MGFFDSFPYSNQHTLNLDWLIKKQRELEEYIKQYTAVNHVAYAGIWDITKQYPQWAVVSNGDKSYMSNKPVPVGIPIENTEYWLHLADIDPRIGGIIADLNRLDKKIDTSVSTIDGEMAAISSNMEAISRNINGKIAAITRNIAGKKFLIIGDSISDENITYNDKISDVWVKHFRPMVEMFGGTVTNLSASSRGYARSAHGDSFQSLIATTDLSKYDSIIVFGGVNDFSGGFPLSTFYKPEANSFWDAVSKSFSKLRASKKEIYIVSPLPTRHIGSSLYNVTLEMYRKVLNSASELYGLHFINGTKIAPFSVDGYYDDGLHPLNAYTHYIAEHIFDKILTNGEPYNEVFEVAEKKNLAGTNCTYTLESYSIGPEVVYDITGTATGEYVIELPNLNLFFGKERRANVTGNTVTKIVTEANKISVYGENVSGPFSITVRGYSNSLEYATFFRHE